MFSIFIHNFLPLGSSAFWLEYANLEKQYGEPHTLRSLFQRALNAIKDWPQCIMDEWLMYERHTGTLEDVMKCIQKCREVGIFLITDAVLLHFYAILR